MEAADWMVKDLKTLQMMDGIAPNIFGGLPGAYPFAAPYCSNSIPTE